MLREYNLPDLRKSPLSRQKIDGATYLAPSKITEDQRSASSFVCMFCNRPNVVGVLRYHVKMTVADDTDESVFVSFDGEITKLTNILAGR